jgi:hypothetical protein
MAITITKPQLGGSENQWGSILNDALDEIVLEINSNADGTNTVTPNLGSGWEVGGVAVTSTAAELNILDGDTTATSTVIADADRVVFNDAGTMKQVAMSDLKTYINASVGSGSVTSVAMSVPTGLSISGSPITTSGTLAVSLASGYVIPQSSQIPSTSDISNWNTAYGWGNHASAGYLTSVPTTNLFGVSQSWQSTSISTQTWYQNSSSKAQMWSINQNPGGSTVRIGSSTSNYVTINQNDGDSGERVPNIFIVPPSHYFYLNSSSTILYQHKMA